jgi:hypothetical protein
MAILEELDDLPPLEDIPTTTAADASDFIIAYDVPAPVEREMQEDPLLRAVNTHLSSVLDPPSPRVEKPRSLWNIIRDTVSDCYNFCTDFVEKERKYSKYHLAGDYTPSEPKTDEEYANIGMAFLAGIGSGMILDKIIGFVVPVTVAGLVVYGVAYVLGHAPPPPSTDEERQAVLAKIVSIIGEVRWVVYTMYCLFYSDTCLLLLVAVAALSL